VAASGGASGNAVTFTIDSPNSSVCSIAGSTVTFTCTLDANQAGNGEYEAAPQVQQSFAVAQSAPPPAVTKIGPRKGRAGGGAIVTITGSNLSSASSVKFGAVAATRFSVSSAATITALAPPGSTGTVDVRVTGPGRDERDHRF
jgi:hypothetical protein